MKAKLVIDVDDKFLDEMGIDLDDLEVDYQVYVEGEHEFDRMVTAARCAELTENKSPGLKSFSKIALNNAIRSLLCIIDNLDSNTPKQNEACISNAIHCIASGILDAGGVIRPDLKEVLREKFWWAKNKNL